MAVPTSVGRLAGSVRVSGERRDAVDQAERDRQVRQQHPDSDEHADTGHSGEDGPREQVHQPLGHGRGFDPGG